MIQVRGLSKKFGDFQALKNINITIHSGETVGLIGPNGAGKTTLMKVLAGLLPPTKFDELALDNVSPSSKELKGKVALVLSNRQLYGELTPVENLKLFLSYYKVKKSKSDIIELLDSVGLADKKTTKAGMLSNGEQQKLNLAKAMIVDADYIFLDEPTGGLDPASSRDVTHLLMKFLKRQKTMIITSHNMGEIEELCSRVLFIDHGSLILDTPLAELKNFSEGNTVSMTLSGMYSSSDIENELKAKGISKYYFQNGIDGTRLVFYCVSEISPLLETIGSFLPMEAVDVRRINLEDLFIHLKNGGLCDVR